VISPGNIDPAKLESARSLVQSGVAAFRQGRFADAVGDLQQASERLAALRKSLPTEALLARQHGISVGFLASALRDLNRPAEALPHARESLAIYESMTAPNPGDLYNMACCCAMMSALDDGAPTEDRDKLQARGVDYLRKAIEENQARILPLISGDRDLDPLRDRADFRKMLADAGFPRDPFEQPSPLGFLSLPSAARDEMLSLSKLIAQQPSDFRAWRGRGDFQARYGASDGALVDYRKVLELHPPSAWAPAWEDTLLAMQAAVVLLQAGDIEGYRRLARDTLDRFASADDPFIAERVAKVNLLLSPPAEDRDRIAALAKRSVDLGQNTGLLGWFRLVRGMSAYRSGDFAESAEWLETALTSDHGPEHRSTCQSYLAMAEFHSGHADRAGTLLAEARTLIEVRLAQEDTGGGWHDLWIAEMAIREAETVLGQPLPPMNSRPSPVD
jgi:tetratricopeptide (TPR) repeat protein